MSTSIKEKYFQEKPGSKSINTNLDEIEALLGRLDGNPNPLAEKIFMIMDEIHHQIRFIRKDDIEDIKVKSQLTYVSKRMRAVAEILEKTIGGKTKLQEKRKMRGVSEEQWWWFLDHYLEEKRKKQFKKTSIIMLVLVIVLAIMAMVYDRFIAPPPEIRARLAYETRINSLIENGEYDAALVEMEQALKLAPDYYPLWVRRGVLAKVLDNDTLEDESFRKALQLAENPEYFYLERGSTYMQFGLLDDLMTDALTILKINPQSAEAYLYMGLVQEVRGQMPEAYQSFKKASILAEEQNKLQLAATVKMRMAMIMQSAAIPTPEN